MKRHTILILLTLGLFASGVTSCGKKTAEAQAKTAAQLEADQKAIAVRVAADKKIADQNAAEALRAAVIKKKAAKEPTTPPK
ncbi:MAG: hypothetical protein Q8M07_27805 [Prosthecobacter sp.]|nr:hypothetical protein [Prosthecobacter sp.]